ncbi:MAG: hypothetical protein LLG13_14415 [Bacteroidales bacterium]|nr:hypothetical protein [Bacteroidales bacterium]
MKKTLFIVGIILVLLLVLPVINLIRWTLQPKKAMNIVLVDKTVPTLEREKHKSFDWILTNERFVKKGKNSSYSYLKDYYGFIPKRPLRDKKWDKNEYRLTELISIAENNDAVYFTDTYGVFFNDWYRGINKSRKSRKIYGGLNNNDFLLIKEMKDRNKLIIMEYNAFDYPTAEFESVRTQEKLGVSFTGWTGKYFHSLDSASVDFPVWMTSIYRKQYNKPWTFTKPGIVILKEKDIIVLEEGTHLKIAMPHVVTDTEYCGKYGVAGSVAFDNWFDIINPLQNNVISKFRIETTTLGDTLLQKNTLDNEFPAVVQDPASQRVYYFSGDFANADIPMWTSRFKGITKLKGIFYSSKPDDTRRFFWLYYRPLINGIFSDYYASMNAK